MNEQTEKKEFPHMAAAGRAGRLEGKIALVTGGARGQGAAEARLFAEEGASVVVADVNTKDGQELADSLPGNSRFLKLDVTKLDEWEQVASRIDEHYGRLDILVNNAGIVPEAGRFDQVSLESHHRLYDVHVHGVFYGMRAMLPLLQKSEAGSIINISSIDGLVGIGGLTSYTSTKFAVTGMTRSAAIDLGPLGIRVNSIHPGVIASPMLDDIQGQRRKRLEGTLSRQPFQRAGRPEEVASLAVYLASDESLFCTGAQFTIDGGHNAGAYRDPLV